MDRYDRFGSALLKNSPISRRENLPILILQERVGTRGHLSGSKSRQEGILSVAASPFVSMMHDTTQWTRIFPPYLLKRVFQQPQPEAVRTKRRKTTKNPRRSGGNEETKHLATCFDFEYSRLVAALAREPKRKAPAMSAGQCFRNTF